MPVKFKLKSILRLVTFGSRLYESLQAYMRVSNQLPTSTWVRDSFYSIVYFRLMKIEEFIRRKYYSAGIYDFNLPVLSLNYVTEYQHAVSLRVAGKLSPMEFKEIEMLIGGKLKKILNYLIRRKKR